MPAAPQDIARLQPTPDSLNVILKNTHFKDDILSAGSKIQFRIDYTADIPVFIFKFPEPFYDFLQVLHFGILSDTNREWLDKEPVIIKLIISDTIITDRLSSLSFPLGPVESEHLRIRLHAQKMLSLAQIQECEEYVYSNADKFLS